MSNNKTRKNIKPETTFHLEDYNSNDGMLTTVWGPGMWHYLHTMTFNYPVKPTKQDKKHYMHFVQSLVYVLPCGKCRKNLVNNFKRLPISMKQMESRDTFSRYMYDLHETVNTMLNKKSGLTFEEVRERYEHFRARCAKSLQKIQKCKMKKMNKTNKTNKTNKKKESGCTEPLYGEKSKCVLQIVPQTEKCDTFQIDDKCIKKNMETILLEQDKIGKSGS